MYRMLYSMIFLLSFYGFLQLTKFTFQYLVPYSPMADILHICLAIVMGVPFSSLLASWITPFKRKEE